MSIHDHHIEQEYKEGVALKYQALKAQVDALLKKFDAVDLDQLSRKMADLEQVAWRNGYAYGHDLGYDEGYKVGYWNS